MARFEIIVSSKGPRSGNVLPKGAGNISRLKAMLAAFLTLAIAIGLFIAALVVGSIIVVLVLIAFVLGLIAILIRMSLRRIRQ